MVPYGLDDQSAGVDVVGLGDRALHPDVPETRATKEAMLLPVKRCQSPISTASPNAVSVDTPRRHAERWTTAVSSLAVARAVIAISRRSRQAVIATAVSQHTRRPSW